MLCTHHASYHGYCTFADLIYALFLYFGLARRHLIADNLGWFKNPDGSEGGKTIEDFMRAKGEEVKRGTIVQSPEGGVEFAPPQ